MASTSELLEFKVSNFNIVAATLGGFLSLFGLVSYLLKEKFYLGEALVSTIAGIIFGPSATNLIKPLEYALGSQENLEAITLYFTRLVLGVQLVLAGIQLPSRYLRTEWKSLVYLLGPGMCFMWISTSLLIWAFVPDIPFLYALAVGSCVTPTDPILSNSIVKGKFADKNIPKKLQKIIIAESGANDGLGYPFLFIALYLIRYVHDGGLGQAGGAGKAIGYWFGITWGYEIALSLLYGAFVGHIFRVALHWAVDRKYVDRESFLVFAITIALFIVGTLGMLGSDDVLACFIAGNVFTWDDWFRLETADDSFQPTIDMLLNVSIFAWYGAICPWYRFSHNNVIPIYRLIFLGILVLLLRRLPIVILLHKRIHQIEEMRQALFVGFFGPIGVSAIFYLYTSREFLRQITVRDHERDDVARLSEILDVVVWFMVICSIIVHGLSIPLGKLGSYLPRTMSRASSTQRSDDQQRPFELRGEAETANIFGIGDGARSSEKRIAALNSGGIDTSSSVTASQGELPLAMYRIGGTIIGDLETGRDGTNQRHTTGEHGQTKAKNAGNTRSSLAEPQSGGASSWRSGNHSLAPDIAANDTEAVNGKPAVTGGPPLAQTGVMMSTGGSYIPSMPTKNITFAT